MIKHKGKIIGTTAMDFAGPSTFKGRATVKDKCAYEIIIYAYDAQTGNTGVDKVKVTVN